MTSANIGNVGNIGLEADVNNIALEAGGMGVVSLTIVNKGPVVDGFDLSVRNLDPSWYTLTQERVALFPEDSLSVAVQLHPWMDGTPLAGTYSFEVVVTSENSSLDSASVTIQLAIAATSDISLKIQPERSLARL